ncbi:TonB-dependent receptor [Pacificimonas sp. ICDLI1SI03]
MRNRAVTTLMTTTAAFAAVPALAQTTGDVAPDAGPAGLTEIVVTAQRVEQNLQDVPVAVTAIGEEEIGDKRVTSGADIAGLVPNLNFTQAGVPSNPTIQIRGISSGTSNNAVDPKVGVYVDGVYVGRTVGALFDLADIQRIEVLRGPQGTLFGRNATGGALSITTATPSGSLGVKGSISYGNFDAWRGKISADLPQFGPFSLRVSYLHDEIGGYVDNALGGQTIDLRPRAEDFGVLTFANELGTRNVDGVQVALRGDFGPVIADYKFDYTDQNGSPQPSQAFGPLPEPGGDLLLGILSLQPPGNRYNFSPDGDPLNPVFNATSNEHIVAQGHSLTVEIPTDFATIKNIAAYRKFRQDPYINDLASSGGLLFTTAQLQNLLTGNIGGVLDPANAPGPNDQFFTLLTSRATEQWQVSNEFQIQMQRDFFDMTSGVFLFHEDSPATDVLGIYQPVDNGVIVDGSQVGLIPGLPPGSYDFDGDGVPETVNPSLDGTFGSGTTRGDSINDSAAIYTQVTFKLSPSFDVSLGARYTWDDRETNITEVAGAQGTVLGLGTYKQSFEKFNYTAIVNWEPVRDILAYAKIATGYVAGGILSGIPYDPESLTSYEIGLKSQLFDDRLRFNAAAFYSDYTDLQTQNFINGRQTFDNAGEAEVKGFEIETTVVPFYGFVLTGNIGYNDLDYKTFILNGVDVADVATTTYNSKWTGRVEAAYESDPFANGANFFARLGASYRGSYFLVSTPILDLLGDPTGQTLSPLEDSRKQPSYWLVDGRIGVGAIDFGGGSVAISAFGKNLTNETPIQFGAPTLSLTGTSLRGRQYGLEITAAF